MNARIEELEQPTAFLSGPAEFLVSKLAEYIAAVPQFAAVFGPRIDPYLRMDYSMRELPALRIYNTTQVKQYETWYLEGDVVMDVIMPPQLRREMLQQYSDTICAALMQQFRRPSFFASMCAEVPGLNELGKTFDIDKTLMFKFQGGEAPSSQIRANFRLLLTAWDEYLTSEDRTVDDPFEATLGDLEQITTAIEGLLDNDTLEVSVESDQSV